MAHFELHQAEAAAGAAWPWRPSPIYQHHAQLQAEATAEASAACGGLHDLTVLEHRFVFQHHQGHATSFISSERSQGGLNRKQRIAS